MIKAVTTSSKRNPREMKTEVTLEGTGQEILHEFTGIVSALKDGSPELLNTALRICKEELE